LADDGRLPSPTAPTPSGCGAGAKRMRRQAHTHANPLQGLPIAVLSVFNELAQWDGIFCLTMSGTLQWPTSP